MCAAHVYSSGQRPRARPASKREVLVLQGQIDDHTHPTCGDGVAPKQGHLLEQALCPRPEPSGPVVLVEVHQAVSVGHLVAVAGAPGDDALAAGAGSAGKAEAVAPSGPPEVVIVRYVQRIRTKRHCPAQWLQDAAAKPGQSAL